MYYNNTYLVYTSIRVYFTSFVLVGGEPFLDGTLCVCFVCFLYCLSNLGEHDPVAYSICFQGCLRLSVRTRCGFLKSKILRSDSVRFLDVVNPMVRCGAVIYPTVRFGSVEKNRKSYDAVRCGFEK